MNHLILLVAGAALTCAMTPVFADDATPPPTTQQSKHQLMKDCMSKENASDVQMTPEQREQVKKTCRDVAKTGEENEQAEKASEQSPAPAPAQ